jgi:hypothetical protein
VEVKGTRVQYGGEMRYDEVDISVVGQKSKPVSVSSHEVFCFTVDGEELPVGLSIACDN